MRVFRVENLMGKGPFDSKGVVNKVMGAMPMYHNTLPTPREDGLMARQYGSVNYCGCLSVQELRETWFPEPCQVVLEAAKFQIAEYEVPDHAVQVGGKQVLFEKYEAELVALHPVRGS